MVTCGQDGRYFAARVGMVSEAGGDDQRRFRLEGGADMTERKAAEKALGHEAKPRPGMGLPKTPLPPGSPSRLHTMNHGPGSTELLVDVKLGTP